MGQNLASVHFDSAQWDAVDQALGVLEQAWGPMLVVLGADGRRRVVKMGDGSEPFCRNTYGVMRKNRRTLPPTVDLDEMERDLATHDAHADRQRRLMQLMEKVDDTDIALGSDVMACALQGYNLFKLTGQTEGLDTLRRDLGRRFEKQGRRKVEKVPDAA